MANIVIKDVKLTPNVCIAGSQFIISVKIADKKYGIYTADKKLILSNDKKIIEKIPQRVEKPICTQSRKSITNKDGKKILALK